MAFTWAAPGGSELGGVQAFTTSSGTVAADATVLFFGEQTVKCTTSAAGAAAYVQKNTILTGTSYRISVRFRITNLPTATCSIIWVLDASNNNSFRVSLLTTGAVQLVANTTLVGSASAALLSTGVDYRLTLCFTISSTSVNEARVYINDTTSPACSATNSTLTTATVSHVRVGWAQGSSGNLLVLNVGQIYIDDDSSLTNILAAGPTVADRGPRVTVKRPANGITNDAAWTNLGNGSVSEGSSALTNGRTLTGTGTGVDTYQPQGPTNGTVNLGNATVLGSYGWVFAAKGSVGTPTDNIVFNAATTVVALTTTAAYYSSPVVNGNTYPSVIGMSRTVGAGGDAIFYDGGVVIAYAAAVPPNVQNYMYAAKSVSAGVMSVGERIR